MALAAPGVNSRTLPRAVATAGERKGCESPWRQRRRSWHKRKAKAGQKFIATSVSQQLDSWTAWCSRSVKTIAEPQRGDQQSIRAAICWPIMLLGWGTSRIAMHQSMVPSLLAS
jgi:hypothetical protein